MRYLADQPAVCIRDVFPSVQVWWAPPARRSLAEILVGSESAKALLSGESHEILLLLTGQLTVLGDPREFLNFLTRLAEVASAYQLEASVRSHDPRRFSVLTCASPNAARNAHLLPDPLNDTVAHQGMLAAFLFILLPKACKQVEARNIAYSGDPRLTPRWSGFVAAFSPSGNHAPFPAAVEAWSRFSSWSAEDHSRAPAFAHHDADILVDVAETGTTMLPA